MENIMVKKQKKIKLDKFHYHEAMDRAYTMCEMVSTILSGHPVILEHKLLSDKVDMITEELANLYQMVANYEFEMSETKKKGKK